MNNIKLTEFSHGAGCGCKISPKELTSILKSSIDFAVDAKLLVGNESRDDAAVYDIGSGIGIISTTDFFMPIVDDPFMFGKIAATNAISDIYAMGGDPLMAIAILGWPVNKIPSEIAQQVMEGGRTACKEAGIILAGGHSIDNPEPIFGLAVTGKVEISKLKKNDTAKAGSKLFLTKPLGVGVLSTAQKQNKLLAEDANIAAESMAKLNKIGSELAKIEGVSAMTDVTGFGLLGHLIEMCEGSNLSAIVDFNNIPIFDVAEKYIQLGCIPGGTIRNWDSYGEKVKLQDESQKSILCDPQTSGGLLIAVEEKSLKTVEDLLIKNGLYSKSIGLIVPKSEFVVEIK